MGYKKILAVIGLSLLLTSCGNKTEEVEVTPLEELSEELVVLESDDLEEEELIVEEIKEEYDYEWDLSHFGKADDAIAAIEALEPVKDLDLETYFVCYKSIVECYKDYIDPPETIYDVFTNEEINLICRVVETETYQCPFEAKANVATVVLNRVEYDGFGDTVREVVTSPSQFVYSREKISSSTLLAVEYAFMFDAPCGDALFFQSAGYKEKFSGGTFCYTDGKHWFYNKPNKNKEEDKDDEIKP